MSTNPGFATGNRLRILLVIVLATISYWLAVVLGAIATGTLTLVVIGLFKIGDASVIPDSMDELKVAGWPPSGIVALAAVVGTFIARSACRRVGASSSIGCSPRPAYRRAR